MENISYENEFDLYENELHMNGFAYSLVLTQRPNVTRIWPITLLYDETDSCSLYCSDSVMTFLTYTGCCWYFFRLQLSFMAAQKKLHV